MTELARRLAAEFLGTAFLLAAVVGSGIMAETLSPEAPGLALLANAAATAAMLIVLIETLGPVSGAHFNPAVTLAMRLTGAIATTPALLYVAAQIVGALTGVALAHLMFDQPVIQASVHIRTGPAQWLSEGLAAFGLVFFIFGGVRFRPAAIPWIVGLYILAAYWFTASTSFANPAVTIARAFTDTFSGIRGDDAAAFIAAQMIGATLAAPSAVFLFGREKLAPASSA